MSKESGEAGDEGPDGHFLSDVEKQGGVYVGGGLDFIFFWEWGMGGAQEN